jgi:hypothetical protein
MSETTSLNFKDSVLEWMTVNNEISMMQKHIRQKRNRATYLGQYIMEYMKDMDKELCNVGESALHLKKRKVTTSLKKPDILRALAKMTSEDEAIRVTNQLFEERKVIFKDYIHLST